MGRAPPSWLFPWLLFAAVAGAGAAGAQEDPVADLPAEDDGPDEPIDAPAPPADPGGAGVALSDAERFGRAQNLFQFGDCESVIDVLGDFTLGAAEKDQRQLVEAHRMLGVCYDQLGRHDEAERELKSLLYLDPDYVLDPLITPPPLIDKFAALKEELNQKLEEIRKAKAERDQQQQNDKAPEKVIVEREKTVRTTPCAVVLLPFGVPQFVNNEPGLGMLFLFLQAIPLVLNVGAFAALQVVRDQPFGLAEQVFPLADPGQQLVIEYALWGTHLAAIAAWGVAYVSGVATAWFTLEDEVVIDERELRPVPAVGTE